LSTVRTITKNTVVLLVSQIIAILFAFLYNLYTARYLGSEGFGVLSFAIAFTGIYGLVADMGLSTLATREVARNDFLAGKYLVNVTIIKLILVVITLILISITINILGYPKQTIEIVYIMSISTILSSFTNLFNSIFQALEKIYLISVGRIIYSVLIFVGTIIAMNLQFDIVLFVTIYLITNIIVLCYSIIVYRRKLVVPTIEFNWNLWAMMLKESIPFWLTSLFVIVYFRIDMIMLSVMKGDSVVGWYAASYRLIDALSIIPSVLMTIMYPVFSKLHLNSKNVLSFAFEKSFNFLIIIATPIGIGTTLLADKIIILIYGTEYAPSIIALKILIWAGFLTITSWAPATLLNSINKQRTLMIITSIGAILNICLNYMLIPTISYKGAGIATVVAELIVGLLMLYEIKSAQFSIKSSIKIFAKSMLSGIIMGILVYILKDYTLFLLIPLAAVVYLIALILTRTFDKQDFDMVNEALKR